MVSTIICNVISSVSEADIGALYLNTKYGVIVRNTLEEIGHPQPTMPPQTEDSTAELIVNITIFQKRSKAMDMHFYWLRSQDNQK